MRVGDLAGEYRAKTDEELLRLAMDSDQLTADAQSYLTSELAKRGISAERVRALRDRPEPLASPPIVPARASYTISPPEPSETSKAPWRPKVAGRIAFFFGPVAGALIVVASLRRMGHPQSAKKVLLLALGIAAAEAWYDLLHSRRAGKTCRFRCGDCVPIDFSCFYGERVQ